MALETELKKNTAALVELTELLKSGQVAMPAGEPTIEVTGFKPPAPAPTSTPAPAAPAADPLADLTPAAPDAMSLEDVRPTLVQLNKRAEPVTYNGKAMSGADAVRLMVESTGYAIGAMPEAELAGLFTQAKELLAQ